MVDGCRVSEDGEHNAINGKLIKFSVWDDGKVCAHYVGECEECGCPIHFVQEYAPTDQYEGDTLEEEHFAGAKEIYVEE